MMRTREVTIRIPVIQPPNSKRLGLIFVTILCGALLLTLAKVVATLFPIVADLSVFLAGIFYCCVQRTLLEERKQ